MTKYIFITWWVCSSLWKWIVASSIWAILKASWYSVFMQKLDPYLNIDPWTMSPFQHWEVFVTEDWAETDLDLGHYERFIDTNLSKNSTITTWRIYKEVLENERKWEYKWKTIQIIPHITDKIIEKIENAGEKSKAKFIIIEIWWTVWDIEWEPFLEAIRQMRFKKWNENTFFVHLTLLPYLKASKELKTKPTQMSVKDLKKMWINPDLLFLRSDFPVPEDILEKISSFCDVEKNAVIPAETLDSIYKVPLEFQKRNIAKVIFDKLKIKEKKADMKKWEELDILKNKIKKEVKIWLVWKYNWLEDAYLSVIEAIKSAWIYNWTNIKIAWIDSEKIEKWNKEEFEKLKKIDGICIPWWFWKRWIEWKIQVAQFCRENDVPYLGLCLGSQILTIEFARNVCNLKNANSEEFDEKTENKIFEFLEWKSNNDEVWWTLRLWKFDIKIEKNTLAYKCYKREDISERHRHRYEFNNKFSEILEKKDFKISWKLKNWKLMEICENTKHKFMIWSQFHPEFKSRPYKPHPLFMWFIKAVL